MIRRVLATTQYEIVNTDWLTYAFIPESLELVMCNSRYHSELADISDAKCIRTLFTL